MHDWTDHDGNGMPIENNCVVDVQFRDGDIQRAESALYWQQPYHGDRRDYWMWSETVPRNDIVAYRIVEASK